MVHPCRHVVSVRSPPGPASRRPYIPLRYSRTAHDTIHMHSHTHRPYTYYYYCVCVCVCMSTLCRDCREKKYITTSVQYILVRTLVVESHTFIWYIHNTYYSNIVVSRREADFTTYIRPSSSSPPVLFASAGKIEPVTLRAIGLTVVQPLHRI